MKTGLAGTRRRARVALTLLPIYLLSLVALVACTATEPLPTLVPTSPPIMFPTVAAPATPALASPTALPPTQDVGLVIAELSPTAAPPTVAPATATPLPTAPPPTAPPPTAAVSGGAAPQCGRPDWWVPYVVQRGDTVGSLAACSGGSIAEIAAANCLASADYILAGDSLWLPRLCAPPPPLPTTRIQPTDTPPIPTEAVSQPGPAGIKFDKGQVSHGDWITITLKNFHPGSTVTITFNPRSDQNVVLDRQHVTADAMGGFVLPYPIPSTFPLGIVFVRAIDNAPEPKVAAEKFTVVPPTATPILVTATTETPTITPTVPPTDTPAPSETPTEVPPPSETPTEAPLPSETPTLEPSLTPTGAPAPG